MGERYVVRDNISTHNDIGRDRRRPDREFVVTYIDRSAAETDAIDRNRTWRRGQMSNRYLFGGENPVEHLTSLPEPVFRDWLQDHDIPLPGPVPPPAPVKDTRPWYQRWFDSPPPPAEPLGEWEHWWTHHLDANTFTAAQREYIADVLDKMIRYQVLAVPSDDDAAGATVFVVYEDDWGACDRVPWHTDPVQAYRTRERAEAERDRLRAETGRRYAVVETTLDGGRPAG